MPIVIKSVARRYMTLGKRDNYALNAMDRMLIKQKLKNIDYLLKIYDRVKTHSDLAKIIMCGFLSEYIQLLKIVICEVPQRGPRILYNPRTFLSYYDTLIGMDLELSQRFRFQSIEQLQRLKKS